MSGTGETPAIPGLEEDRRLVSELAAGDVVRMEPGRQPVQLVDVEPGRSGTFYDFRRRAGGAPTRGNWAPPDATFELVSGPSKTKER